MTISLAFILFLENRNRAPALRSHPKVGIELPETPTSKALEAEAMSSWMGQWKSHRTFFQLPISPSLLTRA